MSTRWTMLLVVLMIGALLVGLQATSISAQAPDPVQAADANGLTRAIEGNFRVFYRVEDVGDGEMRNVRRIEFHEEYFVLFTFEQQGRIVPLDGLVHLRWERS